MHGALEIAFDPELGLAAPAVLTRAAGGAPVPCGVIWTAEAGASVLGAFSGPGRNRTGRTLDALDGETGALEIGDQFAVYPDPESRDADEGGVIYQIVGQPMHPEDDLQQEIWRCEVERV
jgi:hypothetical protein